jgi:hypothetical protein
VNIIEDIEARIQRQVELDRDDIKIDIADLSTLLGMIANSVLQPWVMALPRRAQGGLLVGLRGCDDAPKNPGVDTPERGLVAFLRYCVMVPADAREIGIKGAFFQDHPPTSWKPSQFGHYPQHWYAHIMHSFEIVGYMHPRPKIARHGIDIYTRLVHNLHLMPESKEQMLERLIEDRIATGTVVS